MPLRNPPSDGKKYQRKSSAMQAGATWSFLARIRTTILRKPRAADTEECKMKLIVGLGNPGTEYAGTRHNVGFEVIDELAKRHHLAVTKRSFRSLVGEGQIGGQRTLLAKPQTYMNVSGEAVAAIARFYKIAPADIIVLLDDVALPPGRLRLRYKGSAGGHNGLDNILTLLHTQEVPRIRLGVGAARPGDMRNYVLSRFRGEEIETIRQAIERAADAVECALAEGFETAMNRFN